MSWKDQIAGNTTTWHGVEDYARERINELTGICISVGAADHEIRAAQVGILEMQKLITLPQTIAAEAQIRASQGSRKEY